MPVQGSGTISVTTDASGNVIPSSPTATRPAARTTSAAASSGSRPTAWSTSFADGFDTSGAQDSSSFVDSTLSIGFSADGTILYAADDQGIWQFKTTADLADSTSGSLIGLNDLRTLGVPYDGQNAAVAVVDTGVDANATSFRGRVAAGTNIITGGLGNEDLAPAGGTVTDRPGQGGTGGGGTGGHHQHGPRQLRSPATARRRRRRRPVRPRGHDRPDRYLQPVLVARQPLG